MIAIFENLAKKQLIVEVYQIFSNLFRNRFRPSVQETQRWWRLFYSILLFTERFGELRLFKSSIVAEGSFQRRGLWPR